MTYTCTPLLSCLIHGSAQVPANVCGQKDSIRKFDVTYTSPYTKETTCCCGYMAHQHDCICPVHSSGTSQTIQVCNIFVIHSSFKRSSLGTRVQSRYLVISFGWWYFTSRKVYRRYTSWYQRLCWIYSLGTYICIYVCLSLQ